MKGVTMAHLSHR